MTPKEKHTGKECKYLNNLEEICENTRAMAGSMNTTGGFPVISGSPMRKNSQSSPIMLTIHWKAIGD
jgi:hypothetical protein